MRDNGAMRQNLSAWERGNKGQCGACTIILVWQMSFEERSEHHVMVGRLGVYPSIPMCSLSHYSPINDEEGHLSDREMPFLIIDWSIIIIIYIIIIITSLTPSLTHSLTHSLTPSLTHSLTHSLTPSLLLLLLLL